MPTVPQTLGYEHSDTRTAVQHDDLLPTPVTSESVEQLCTRIEAKRHDLDVVSRHELTKPADAARKSIPERDILAVDNNNTLAAQHQRRDARSSIRSVVVGAAKVMSYEDIVAARRKA